MALIGREEHGRRQSGGKGWHVIRAGGFPKYNNLFIYHSQGFKINPVLVL